MQNDDKRPSVGEFLRFFGPSWRKRRPWLLLLGGLTIVAAVVTWVVPQAQRGFINALNSRLEREAFLFLILTGILMLLQWLFAALETHFGNGLSIKMGTELKVRVLRNLMELPMDFFVANGGSYLSGRLYSDLETAGIFFVRGWLSIARETLKLTGGLVFVFVLDWRFGLGLLPVLPVYVGLAWFFRNRQYHLSRSISEVQARSGRSIHATLANIMLVKNRASEAEVAGRVSHQLEELGDLKVRRFRHEGLFRLALQVIPGVCLGVLCLVGVRLIMLGEWTLGELWAMSCYIAYALFPVRSLCVNYMQMNNALAAVERLIRWTGMQPEQGLEEGVEAGKLAGEVEFRDIGFAFPGKPALFGGLSCHIRPGEIVALTGPSGTGKSTLVHLLLRLFVPSAGAILIDGRDAADYNLKSLRRRIACISQIPEFLTGTLAENLTLGLEERPDDPVIVGALERLGLGRVIGRLPDGIHTALNDNAAGFSVGERFRLTLARELLREVDIIIMDEATANLDREAEQMVMRTVREVFAGRTVIMISHRDSTVACADRVLELRDGLLTENP